MQGHHGGGADYAVFARELLGYMMCEEEELQGVENCGQWRVHYHLPFYVHWSRYYP